DLLPQARAKELGARNAGGAAVLVGSYGAVRSAVEKGAALTGDPWDLLILDEAQAIKNRSTATHQALARIPRSFALGLTGTPVENGPEELRTLLDFVLPGYLPPEAEFRRRFAQPIEGGEPKAREALARLARP